MECISLTRGDCPPDGGHEGGIGGAFVHMVVFLIVLFSCLCQATCGCLPTTDLRYVCSHIMDSMEQFNRCPEKGRYLAYQVLLRALSGGRAAVSELLLEHVDRVDPPGHCAEPRRQ